MILKGSQRGYGDDLAIHLMNGFENERIEIAEVYGAVAGDLFGAFAEFEAVASGTRAENYLYSLSINPPEPISREQYHACIQEIEHGLGLEGQPRAVVFHVKHGREHCHVVWSRIDVEAMKAVHIAFDHEKLMDLSIRLARKHGFSLTEGQRAWAEKRKYEKEKLEPTLAEKAHEQDTGLRAEERRAAITACYELSDSGYMLAKGDRRGFVVVDEAGNALSLSRYVKGHTAKQIRDRLHPLTPDQLPDVAQARELAKTRRKSREEDSGDTGTGEGGGDDGIASVRDALSRIQQQRRHAASLRQQELLVRQQSERLALKAAQEADRKRFSFRARTAVADFIGRTPGLRSVLEPLQNLTGLDPREKQLKEVEALAARHKRERAEIEREERVLGRLERRESRSLERKIEALRKEAEQLAASRGQELSATNEQEDTGRSWRRGDVQFDFNESGGFVESDAPSEDFDLDAGDGYGPEDNDDGNKLKSGRKGWTRSRKRGRRK